ncbi:hypothetical protein ISP15_04500 [Dyella jejuensis]|uniref:Uncharacterized protein n=1 Tax=Dyella jejuensis TaxID=1432009 RepID=A0ABW8JI88_9GAMM
MVNADFLFAARCLLVGFGSTTRPRTVGSVEDYAKRVRVAAAAIHEVDPDAVVVAGGATNSDMHWFEAFARNDALSAIDYLARFMALARASRYVRGVWWYDLIDDGSDPDNRENRFGLFNQDGTPKPAARRIADSRR